MKQYYSMTVCVLPSCVVRVGVVRWCRVVQGLPYHVMFVHGSLGRSLTVLDVAQHVLFVHGSLGRSLTVLDAAQHACDC